MNALARAPRWVAPAAIVATALGLRFAVQLALGFYEHPDAFEYDDIARNIVAGRGYVFQHDGTMYSVFAEPLFTLILAASYAAFGTSAATAGALLLLLAAASSLLAYRIGLRVDGPFVGVLSGLAIAFHPGLVVYASRLHALSLDVALVLACTLALLALPTIAALRGGLLFGGLGGAALLERATLVVVLFAGLGLALIWLRADRRRILRIAVVSAALCALIVAPWLIRSQLLIGTPALTSSGSEVLWYGNNPNASGGAVTESGQPMLDASPALRDRIWGRPELEQDHEFAAAAREYILADPLRTLRADAGKLASFWWFTPRSGLLYPRGWLVPYQLYYVIVLAFAVLGVWVLARRRRMWILASFAVCLAGISTVQAVYYVEGRHRWEVEGLLLVLAAVGVAGVIARRRGGDLTA